MKLGSCGCSGSWEGVQAASSAARSSGSTAQMRTFLSWLPEANRSLPATREPSLICYIKLRQKPIGHQLHFMRTQRPAGGSYSKLQTCLNGAGYRRDDDCNPAAGLLAYMTQQFDYSEGHTRVSQAAR